MITHMNILELLQIVIIDYINKYSVKARGGFFLISAWNFWKVLKNFKKRKKHSSYLAYKFERNTFLWSYFAIFTVDNVYTEMDKSTGLPDG